jgi:protein-L-isoaspartate(D-aspartate) O-methyltransferase
MVKTQIVARAITHEQVIQALLTVPRHHYVPQNQQQLAYQDSPLPIPHGQTISQPYIVALMTEILQPQPHEIVLEIGTGSGYQTGVLSQLYKQVYTLEILPALAWQARQINHELGYRNITYLIADGSLGWPGTVTFDAILVSAAAPKVPQTLLSQLKDQGRLIIPVGRHRQQTLELWVRQQTEVEVETVLPVAFVPLRGRHGWSALSFEE